MALASWACYVACNEKYLQLMREAQELQPAPQLDAVLWDNLPADAKGWARVLPLRPSVLPADPSQQQELGVRWRSKAEKYGSVVEEIQKATGLQLGSCATCG